MSKVLLVVDMHDGEYKYFENYNKHKMVVDIGVDYDPMLGWTFIRRKVLLAKRIKRIPQKKYDGLNFFEWKRYKNQGWNECIEEILGGKEE